MRITEAAHTPHINPATGAPQPAAPLSQSVQTPAVNIYPPATLTERLTSLLAELGLDVPSAQVEGLARQIAGLGFAPAELDREGALRALFLNRNSVPLAAVLLKAPSSPESPVLFQQAAALMEEAVTLLDSRSLTVEARTAIESLARDLGILLGGSAPFSGLLGEIIRDKGEKTLNPAAPVLESFWGSAAEGDAFVSILRKSGMAFEWRLLAWYQAGRDPGALRDLLHGDLKGILFYFLRDMEKSGDGETLAGKLGERARSLLDSITARQVTHLLDSSGEQRALPLVVPAEEPRERMYAGVRNEGRKGQDDPLPEPELFSLTLNIETAYLGPVRAQLRFSGKMTSAAFLLKDRRTLALAEEMADEFRGMLRERGYEPGIIRFALAGREAAYPGGNPDPRNSLDVQG